MIKRMSERDKLLQAYAEAKGEEKSKILAKLAVIDEEEALRRDMIRKSMDESRRFIRTVIDEYNKSGRKKWYQPKAN